MKSLTDAERLEIRKRAARRKSAKKRRKRRPVTQACIDIQCSSVKFKERRDGRLSCNPTCLRISCPLEEDSDA